MALVEFDHLTYAYPRARTPALKVTHLALEAELVIVGGPSGAGKSTLLRLFNGLVPHFHGGRIRGVATIRGLDVLSTPTRRLAREVGFVFQDPERQFLRGEVEHEVAFSLENTGVEPEQMPQQVSRALHLAGVEHLRGRRVTTLSGGERQRVAIACALALQPRILVLDEPTVQLDGEGRVSVERALLELRDRGHCVVIADHRPRALLERAERTLWVESGLVAEADPGALAGGLPPFELPAPGRRTWSLDQVTGGPEGIPVLRRLCLEGREGEVVSVTGPNGAGKTTLLRILSGLLRPGAGQVSRPAGRCAYLPQDPGAVLHRSTVREEVRLTLDRARGGSEEEIMRQLHLTHLADRDPRELSGGERQRAAIAAIAVGHPQLVLLDEPTRGMDEKARVDFGRLVQDLARHGSSVVLATHDHELAHAVSHRVVELKDGRIR